MKLSWTWARFDDLGVHALHDALALRCKVFILEQGPYQDPDGADKLSWHLLGYDDAGALQACLRVVDPGVNYPEPSIGRVVTAKEARGNGTGRALVAEGFGPLPAGVAGQGRAHQCAGPFAALLRQPGLCRCVG